MGARVIDLSGAKEDALGLVDSFLITDAEVNKLRDVKETLGYVYKPYGKVLRSLIEVAFMNADVNYPPEVFVRAYELYRAEGLEWVRVVAPRSVMRKVMTLATIAAQGIANALPMLRRNNLVETLSTRPRLGVDFALVAFEYFVSEDWKGAKYVWRVGRLRGGEA